MSHIAPETKRLARRYAELQITARFDKFSEKDKKEALSILTQTNLDHQELIDIATDDVVARY